MNKKTVLSCIQPTGDMHLGNYFGAIKNWIGLQKEYRCMYGVVDYHAMTMPYDVERLRLNTWELITNLMATGIHGNNLFVQSLVPEHTELCWILNCFCSYGQLTRMTQFKDKSNQVSEQGKEDFISAGLLDYPVLQSADILIYRADFVPVGKDQEQHLELTRDIAQRFNNAVKKEYFVLPEALYTETPKIKSTADPSRKMSKSAGEKHYISVFAEEDRIRKQIKSAVTDTGSETSGQMSEGIENLFELIKASGNIAGYKALMDDYKAGKLKYSDLKEVTTSSILDLVRPIQERKNELNLDKKKIKDQVRSSSHEIRKIAQETLKEVKELAGLLNVKY
jgi:tryptophanyl-tRNA synthetase